MAKRPRWAVLLSLLVVGAVIAALGTVLLRSDDPDGPASVIDRILSPGDDGNEAAGDADGSSAGAASSGTLAETGTSGSAKRTAVKVKDVPAPPASGPSAEEAWQQYLTETRAIVESHESDLAAVVAQITQALSEGDSDALGDLLAPDEGSQEDYLDELAGTYPEILESTPGGNVNIFTTGGATVYFAYSIVTWTDGGLVSEHTIPIMLRFVDGQWHITTLGDTGSDLVFVQMVQL